MQDRYAGDVGDFGKLGMLRQISKTGLKVGVNWYLTPDEDHNDDGKHVTYITDKRFDNCDDELRFALKNIVDSGSRSVSALEKSGVLDAEFYNDILHSPGSGAIPRIKWHKQALDKLSGCEIVFVDPDNGLLVKSVSPNGRKSNKYVLEQELVDYYRSGKSVVFYNHRSRLQEEEYLKRFRDLAKSDIYTGSQWYGLKFSRGTIRDYFFIVQREHDSRIRASISNLLASEFIKHFSELNFK